MWWVCKWLARKSFVISQLVWHFPFAAHRSLFAAPMAGASPDNIGAKRLAEGGVPASGAGSAPSGFRTNQTLQ
jgi:hypothetical protein